MINRETPLAEIVGQMSLSRSTDVLTKSWVFISVNKHDLTKLARWLYTHKRQELMAGDEVSGNNAWRVMLVIELMCIPHALKMLVR